MMNRQRKRAREIADMVFGKGFCKAQDKRIRAKG